MPKKVPRAGANFMLNITDFVGEVKLSYSTSKKIHQKAITSSDCINDFLKKIYDFDTIEHHESFYAIFLNRSNLISGYHLISSGGLSACVVDVRLICQAALLTNSSSVILSHNHPSGNIKPSQADINITNKFKEALDLFDIKLLDHLIMTKDDYYSFSNEGLL